MDLFQYDFYKTEKKMDQELNRMPKIGDKVLIPSIDHEGIIDYIDDKNLFNHHFFPIQVHLLEPFDYQFLYRTSLKDMVYVT